jgi:hypothetical protein
MASRFFPLQVASAKLRRSRRAVAVWLAIMTAGLIWFLSVAPVFLTCVAVVGGAGAWCFWLERHPEKEPE